MSIFTATHCFYVPGEHWAKDACFKDGDTWRGYYSGKTLEEMREEEPSIQVCTYDELYDAINAATRTQPRRITEEDYWYALEVLPPVAWRGYGECESFKMCERINLDNTSIYCRISDEYFTLVDSIRTPHGEVVKRCEEWRKANPAA